MVLFPESMFIQSLPLPPLISSLPPPLKITSSPPWAVIFSDSRLPRKISGLLVPCITGKLDSSAPVILTVMTFSVPSAACTFKVSV